MVVDFDIDGDGTITLGLADNTIDFSKIKNDAKGQ